MQPLFHLLLSKPFHPHIEWAARRNKIEPMAFPEAAVILPSLMRKVNQIHMFFKNAQTYTITELQWDLSFLGKIFGLSFCLLTYLRIISIFHIHKWNISTAKWYNN